ncbi:MAG: PEP-CTERM sorting domain-containing protein [Phycisphaerales bacterium]|nr:PEP-CTERM sorting domain-containing protein [Phycisphaerales bacterium]
MKGKGILSLACIAAIGVMASHAAADYSSIYQNLLNGVDDTNFDPNTGEFTIDSIGTDLITLTDFGVPLTGTISNSEMHMNTFFNTVDFVLGEFRGKFTGGNFSLTFDYDADGVGPGLPTSHEISGPITAIWFLPSDFLGLGRLDGLGRWTATTVDLPGSDIWPDGGGFSSWDSFTIDFSTSLSNFDWETDDLSGRTETQYTLLPNDAAIPEPATFALVAFGTLAMLRRRS